MKYAIAVLILAAAAWAQMPSDCPMHEQHMKQTAQGEAAHHAGVQQRGEEGMGFSQTETTHHFLLAADGGAIQVEANDPQDAKNRDDIREHLQHIAQAFAAGDFSIPMFVHDRKDVPGVRTMQKKKSAIQYRYQQTDKGGRVNISSQDAKAIAAIRDFLAFQIKDHQTGDPLP